MAKPDLRQALSSLSTAKPAEVLVDAVAVPNVATTNAHFRPSRAGKATVTGYYPREVRKQLRKMAADQDTTIEDLLAEALNDLFAKHGRPEIVPRKQR